MSAKIAMSVEQYLTKSFPDLDKEYRNGELEDRSQPDSIHGRTQLRIGAFFVALKDRMSLWPCLEARMKLRDDLYLIPDISVFHLVEPPSLPDTPPLVVIEIVSDEDRMMKVRNKLDDYHAWGVPHIWLVDPYNKDLYTCDSRLLSVDVLRVPELGIEVTPTDIFE